MVSTGPAYSLTIRCEYDNSPGMLGKITTRVGECGGNMAGIDVIAVTDQKMVRDFTVYASGIEHGQEIKQAMDDLESLLVIPPSDRAAQDPAARAGHQRNNHPVDVPVER